MFSSTVGIEEYPAHFHNFSFTCSLLVNRVLSIISSASICLIPMSLLKCFLNSSNKFAFVIVFFGIKCCVLKLNSLLKINPSTTFAKFKVVTPFHK